MFYKELLFIYVFLVIIYFDFKCLDDVISCYFEELEIMEEGNYKEVSKFCSVKGLGYIE